MDRYVCQLCFSVVYFGDKHPCFSNMDDEIHFAVPHRSHPPYWGLRETAENSNGSYGDMCKASLHASYTWQASSFSAQSVFSPRNKELSEGAIYFSDRSAPPQASLHAPSKVSNVEQTFHSKQNSGAEAGPSGIRHQPLGPDGERQFPDHLYSKMFHQKSYFAPHFMKHTHEAPHACGKGLVQKLKMDANARTPIIQKLKACKFCGKEFTRKINLDKHLRTHTGEKPFACNYCGKRFTQKCNLDRHVRKHTGDKPYKCDVCGRSFSDQSNRNQHVQTHYGIKRFTCGKTFIRNEHRNRHARERH